jgi:predicted RNA binding protein YcfA (HicA-like mRNA interferase family)
MERISMPRRMLIKGLAMVALMEAEGYYIARIKGSHYIMEKILPTGEVKIVHVPVHRHRYLAPGTLKSILHRASIERTRVIEWFQK